MSEVIYVTRPYLPPLAELLPYLERIWESRTLTNNGPFHQQLEQKLRDTFGVPVVSLTANGMLALETAVDALDLEGEIVTTPYSFVATAHAVKTRRLQPVFADVRRHDLNVDPAAVEAAIGPRTTAIVAVHCYGNPCDVEAIDAIAARHGLAVIYDAAHAFGVRLRGRSICSWGDFAALSFHATKAFNTFEGGALASRHPDRKVKVERLRNFGIADEVTVPLVGTNAKMSEFNAAVGLLQLEHFAEVVAERARIDRLYRELLGEVGGIECLAIPEGVEPNYCYFPVLVTPDYPLGRDRLLARLQAEKIFTRRYFYPLISSLPMYRDHPSAQPGNLPVATRAAEEILCLPIYPGLSEVDQHRIVRIIARGEA